MSNLRLGRRSISKTVKTGPGQCRRAECEVRRADLASGKIIKKLMSDLKNKKKISVQSQKIVEKLMPDLT